MSASTATRTPVDRPGVVDALGLVPTIVANEIVLSTIRDTHRAWANRAYRVVNRASRNRTRASQRFHDGISSTIYTSVGVGLVATGMALKTAGEFGVGPRLDDSPRGRFVRSAINGLIGDRFVEEGSRLAIEMGVRRDGQDVPVERGPLTMAFPQATSKLVIFIHGLSENEDYWNFRRDEMGTTYPEAVLDLGWTPIMIRANTGKALRESGVELAALLRVLAAEWPVGVERIALVGHSMGGLIARSACAVAVDDERPWTGLISDVVTLGSPHAGAPIAVALGHGSRLLAHLPETSAFGKILDQRSVGIEDLVDGLGHDVPPMSGVHYRLVAATLTASETHPVGKVVGDFLVQVPSAHGRSRRYPDLFPDSEVLHVPRTDHFGLLNHPDVHRWLKEWLQ